MYCTYSSDIRWLTKQSSLDRKTERQSVEQIK
jgi:hypothetical protein